MFAVYVLEHIPSGRSYVGISTDPPRRLRQHNGIIKGGARCTRTSTGSWVMRKNTPPLWNRSEAMSHERWVKKGKGLIKRMERLDSITPIEQNQNEKNDTEKGWDGSKECDPLSILDKTNMPSEDIVHLQMAQIQHRITHMHGYFNVANVPNILCRLYVSGETGLEAFNTSYIHLKRLWKVLTSIKSGVIIDTDYTVAYVNLESELQSMTNDTRVSRGRIIEPDMYPYVKQLHNFIRGPLDRVHKRIQEVLGMPPSSQDVQSLSQIDYANVDEEALKKTQIPDCLMDKLKEGEDEPTTLKVLRESVCLEYNDYTDKMPVGPTHRAYMKALCLFYCYEQAPIGLTGLVNKLRNRLVNLAPEKHRSEI